VSVLLFDSCQMFKFYYLPVDEILDDVEAVVCWFNDQLRSSTKIAFKYVMINYLG
jgi:hypothetical protein